MYPGAQLAALHIEALGGPKLVIDARDAGYGDTAKGVAMARAFGSAGYPLVLTSLAADADSELPYFKQYKMFAIDSGAAELANEGLPFFYQGRSLFPIDPEVGLLKYWKAKEPQIKRVSYLTLQSGTNAAYNALNDAVRQRVEQAGFTWAGVVGLPITVTDFAPGFAQLREQRPDGIISTVDGGPSSVLLAQWPNSGLKGKAILAGSDTVEGVTAAQADGFQFAFDYFQTTNPGNDWGVLFAKEYLRVHGSWPIYPYYTANYYETTFVLWELIMRVIAAGGDPTKQGDQWITAFNKNPSFPSVYAPSGRCGTNVFGVDNHTLVKREMTVGVYKGLTPTVLATFSTGGADFTLTNASQ
jgi:branched-chain amino acid transport system substrate-binding protein